MPAMHSSADGGKNEVSVGDPLQVVDVFYLAAFVFVFSPSFGVLIEFLKGLDWVTGGATSL